MAFSLRKMLSNMGYFKKEEDGSWRITEDNTHGQSTADKPEPSLNLPVNVAEPDSTSRGTNLPDSAKLSKKGLSESDLLKINGPSPKKHRKKLRLDIRKANKSLSESEYPVRKLNKENTPQHISLGCKSSEIFLERMKGFNFDKSIELDNLSEGAPSAPFESYCEELGLLSEHSDSDVSILFKDENDIKMCRKVNPNDVTECLALKSVTPESFGDLEMDCSEDERISLLLSYQLKLEKIENILQSLLGDFQFHINVSKVFKSKEVAQLPETNVSNLPELLGEMIEEDASRPSSPASWNMVIENRNTLIKFKLRKQLLSMKDTIEAFIQEHLEHSDSDRSTPEAPKRCRQVTFNLEKPKIHINNKKKHKRLNDFPDFQDALQHLFGEETADYHEECKCCCHDSDIDSGVKMEEICQSITSSIGNFSLDSSLLTAYSESLDQIISYTSFEESNLYNTMLRKPAVERITFYVQAHSIQIKSDQSTEERTLTFHCPACSNTEVNETDLLRHILSFEHGEKIHFLYKKAYIKRCFSEGREIQPSTVLNPMTMYRDENKIVCFGEAVYACTFCYENPIVGESVLMAHCSEEFHVDLREHWFDGSVVSVSGDSLPSPTGEY